MVNAFKLWSFVIDVKCLISVDAFWSRFQNDWSTTATCLSLNTVNKKEVLGC